MLSLTVNGEARQLAEVRTCADLIAVLGLAGKRLAVERNGEIVPRSSFGQSRLADGDRIEVVIAVGGG